MQMTGNTILITGGGTGIGRGLAEAFHARGNTVIIAGRRRDALDRTLAANPGLEAIELDISDPASIERVAADVLTRFPKLNVLVNNAGVMLPCNPGGPVEDDAATRVLDTNFLGPVRLTSALIEHLKTQPAAVIVNTSSVLGFVPVAGAAIYSASKAALHAYTMAQRFQLRNAGVAVIELVPPRVQLDPDVQEGDVQGMPLADFITAVMPQLEAGADEILIGQAQHMRANPGANERAFFNQLNNMMEHAQLH